jgi:hypothetical protein
MPNELWAALLGGMLSLLGTLLTLWLQQRNARTERQDVVARFVVEQAEYLRDVAVRLEANFEKYGEVWIEDVDQIELILNVFVRNLEHLIHLEDETLRKQARSFFTESYYIARRARFWQQKVWDAKSSLAHDMNPEYDRKRVENEVISAQVEAKNCIIDLKAKSSLVSELRARLAK